ncbi:CaiB/BaiF CoA transferase family protein [Winogradskyella alexanderae]|uniref:CoA transferase n=1 Tax=Winogradskyella alexanderae TaxID=2877123 RepID=A0ABS7XU25_9FLAO|nr:CoA transferase [Winogradskyella alexanderae]MCA0133531.1 CoA transferase [Winogradskyella alexanderae]
MFKNLKVVELASVLAGPLTGTFFAELGAQVIKIENKLTNGDVTRTWKLPTESKERAISAYYCAANFNKESLLLNITDSSDYEILISHIKDADIVITNYKPSTARKLKLTYDDLKQHKPSLIFAELTGFGDGDSRPAFDVVLQAETGFMFMNGEPNRNPVKMPVALIDVLAAHHLKEAILCAIINKLNTGKGKHIKISLYQSALASLANQATNWLMENHIPQPMGTQHPNIAPYGDMYKTKDGKLLVLAIGSDKQFENLCILLKIELDEFRTNDQRVAKREALNRKISEYMIQKTSNYWVSHLDKRNIPYGIVKNMQEVFEDRKAQKMLLHEDIEGIETVRVKTSLV